MDTSSEEEEVARTPHRTPRRGPWGLHPPPSFGEDDRSFVDTMEPTTLNSTADDSGWDSGTTSPFGYGPGPVVEGPQRELDPARMPFMPLVQPGLPAFGPLHVPATSLSAMGPALRKPSPQGAPKARGAVPKLSFKGIRTSLQGCTGLGAPPPEEPQEPPHNPPRSLQLMPSVATSGTSGHSERERAQSPSLAAIPPQTEIHEPVITTPTNSGYQSPMASSAISAVMAEADFSCVSVIHQNVFYFEGRQRRRIYEDLEMHALVLTLILALLLTPKLGLLDHRYCDQYPLMQHKRNIPFLLSLHLNHSANKAVLPCLAQHVETISHIGGFRLLKLLCETAMHRWMYSDWSCIAGGTFGTVYQCAVKFTETGTVAVKQISKQTSIQDRCVFYDVFSEVACLDAIRFEDNVCQLFDYGVDESGFWIVMKYYPTTLKKWRESLSGSLTENLVTLLGIFRQCLRAVQLLHRRGIVHYDLKCDNIMLDPERALNGDPMSLMFYGHDECDELSNNGGDGCESHRSMRAPNDMAWSVLRDDPSGQFDLPSSLISTDRVPYIALADFGESRMLSGMDELDTRNRGTELVKCPEMIELEKVGKKAGANYDRRKRVGTNQAADVWSVGCLIFELLTGRFLFQDEQFGEFWARLTNHMFEGENCDIISESNIRRLEGNTPLIDFIRYVLVRDPQRRPTITAVAKKFESSAEEAIKWASRHLDNLRSEDERPTKRDSDAGRSFTPRSVTRSIGASSGDASNWHMEQPRPDRLLLCAAGETHSYFTKVLHDLSVLEASDHDLLRIASGGDTRLCSTEQSPGVGGADSASTLRPLLARSMWTHVVDFRLHGASLPCHPEPSAVLVLPWMSSSRKEDEFIGFLPAIFDFLRHAAITRGIVLFLDGYSSGAGRGGLAMAAILALTTEIYRMGVYPAMSYLSSQLFIAAIRPDVVATLAKWQETERSSVWRRCEGMVRISCMCGSCSWHVPSSWLAEAALMPSVASEHGSRRDPHVRAVSCSCNARSQAASSCPSRGSCESYICWLQARFGVTIPSVHWLWLPEGIGAEDCSDGPHSGALSRGLVPLAEPVVEMERPQDDGAVRVQRFRCRSCQVLTHAEVSDAGGRGDTGRRVAVVASYEHLRLSTLLDAAADTAKEDNLRSGSFDFVSSRRSSGSSGASLVSRGPMLFSNHGALHRRPPHRLCDTRLEEVLLPLVQPDARDLFDACFSRSR